MPNYDYANSTGLSALSERTFEKIKKEITTDVVTSEAANPLVLETESSQTAKSTVIDIEPIQDLHGQANPYPAGGGKNLLPMTVELIKANNTSGTWNGNTYTTAAGITFTLQANSTGTVIGIVVNGTSTGSPQIRTGRFDTGTGTYTFSTNVSNGSSNTFYGRYVARDSNGTAINIDGSVFIDVYTTETTKTVPSNTVCIDGYVGVANGVTVNNVVFKPMIRLASVSDATFAPYSNICPIRGLDEVKVERTGKNLLLNKMARTVLSNGITYSLKDDGTVVLNGTASSTSLCDFLLSSDKYIIPKGDYILSDDYSKAGSWGTFLSLYKDGVRIAPDLATTYGSGVTSKAFSTSSYDYDAMAVGIYIASGVSLNNAVFKPMIRLASGTDDTYEPYTPSEVSVDLPTTIYGGTLNLETGELVCDYGMVDLGTLSWVKETTVTDKWRFHALFADHKKTAPGKLGNMICSIYPTVTGNNTWLGVFGISNNGTLNSICVCDMGYSNSTAFQTAMSGAQLCYELETPVIYQLTPQQLALLKGINNISTNAKTVQVTYREGSLATLEELNVISFDLSNVKSKLPPIIIKNGMLQVTYDDGQ